MNEIININEAEEIDIEEGLFLPVYKNNGETFVLFSLSVDKLISDNENDPIFIEWIGGQLPDVRDSKGGIGIGGNTILSSVPGGIALGNGSTLEKRDLVDSDNIQQNMGPLSVGSAVNSKFRRITAVADGVEDYDAATIGQLKSISGGRDGESAYEIAVRNGFIGNELEWLESLKAKTEKNTWVFRGDLSVTGNQRVWEFENIRINISRKSDSEIGIIFYSDVEIDLQIVSSHIADFSINTKKIDEFTVTAAGKIVDDINVSEDWLQARIIQGDTVYKVEGFGFGSPTAESPVYFSKCFMLVEKITASDIIDEVNEPYLRRWEDDLSMVGATMEIPVDNVIFTVAYKGLETLSMTVRPIVAGTKIAFNRSSIYHGTPEATWKDWSELIGETDVDDTIYNDARDRCSVRFMTEQGSYKLDLVSFDKGRKVEALLYNYSEIPVEG